MTHRQQSHPAGSFPHCPHCNREPRHIVDGRAAPVGGHLLSCTCGDSAKFPSLAGALRAWCASRNVSMTVRPVTPRRSLQAVRP